jgi:hypothetical protein
VAVKMNKIIIWGKINICSKIWKRTQKDLMGIKDKKNELCFYAFLSKITYKLV